MFKIKIKSLLSILISKLVLNLSKIFFKGGSNFPGRVALKFDRQILSEVSKNYKVIIITGTNGKTTTTSMIYNILKTAGYNVITNSTGANMLPGIVSCFIDNFHFKSSTTKYAVIEADEANVKYITSHITPSIITVTNLFRDQLDRYGEVYTTLNKILDGIKPVKETTLVLNGDESLLGSLEIENRTVYYGFAASVSEEKVVDINADAKFCKICKTPYSYNHITYNHLGDFYCTNCGYKRPELTYSVDTIQELTPEKSIVSFNGDIYTINQPGIYNIYNALCAFSVSRELGVSQTAILESLKAQGSHFGRQELIRIGSKDIKIILVKNPAGYNQAIDTVALDSEKIGISFLLNDNYADGRDVSWIWDVNFEKLSRLKINSIHISGIRLYDMAVRLKIAGLDMDKFIITPGFEELLTGIINSDSEKVYILATYTAMINFRKFLHGKGYIKELWQGSENNGA